MTPSSAAAANNLVNAKNIEEFLAENREYMLGMALSEYLMLLLQQKKRRRAAVVRDSGLEKAYVYQIFDGKKRPSRDKLIAIAFGLHLNAEETQRMLKLGGWSELYPRVERDAVILFAIQRGKDIAATNDSLYRNGFPTLFDQDK